MQIEDAQQKEKNHKLMSEHIESRSLAHKKAVAQRVKQERRILKQERRLQRELQQTETTKCMEKREMFEQIRRCNEEAEQQKAQRLKQEREEDLRTLEEYERQLVERDRQREVSRMKGGSSGCFCMQIARSLRRWCRQLQLQAQARCRTDWRVHEPDLNEKMSASGHDDRILLEQMQKEMREWERKEKEKAIKRVEERNARNLILQRQVQEKAVSLSHAASGFILRPSLTECVCVGGYCVNSARQRSREDRRAAHTHTIAAGRVRRAKAAAKTEGGTEANAAAIPWRARSAD